MWLCECPGRASDEAKEEVQMGATSPGDEGGFQMEATGSKASHRSLGSSGGGTPGSRSGGVTFDASATMSSSAEEGGMSTASMSNSRLDPTSPTSSMGEGGFLPTSPTTRSAIPPQLCISSGNITASGNSNKSVGLVAEEHMLAVLAGAQEPANIWIRESLVRWRALPLGDDCIGVDFLAAAETIPEVYPWIFHMSYAVRYLTKEFTDHISLIRKNWPAGANSLREAVKSEVKSLGGEPQVEKRYWKTLTCRLLWVVRTIRMFEVLMDALANTDDSPVDSGKQAIETLLQPYLSWALKKIAQYIVGVCVYRDQDDIFKKIGVPGVQFKDAVAVIYPLLRKHADSLESMLREEVPSVFARKAA